jgi:hypothetical protein
VDLGVLVYTWLQGMAPLRRKALRLGRLQICLRFLPSSGIVINVADESEPGSGFPPGAIITSWGGVSLTGVHIDVATQYLQTQAPRA